MFLSSKKKSPAPRGCQRIGYARVSTDEQDLTLQLRALESAGCQTVYTDKGVSGILFSRPGLDAALQEMQDGDVLVVWRLDRLGRSLGKLIQMIEELRRRGIQFHSLSESIDTTSPGGKLVFHMMAAIAEFERSLISDRTKAGMAAALANGKRIGRKAALSKVQRESALQLLESESVAIVAQRFNVHPRTLYRIKNVRNLNAQSDKIRK